MLVKAGSKILTATPDIVNASNEQARRVAIAKMLSGVVNEVIGCFEGKVLEKTATAGMQQSAQAVWSRSSWGRSLIGSSIG